MSREMKDSGVEWIGEVPQEWIISKFKYVSELYTGVSIRDADKDNYLDRENSLTYIATKDIDSTFHSIDYSNVLYTKKDDEKFKVAPKNSTLMCIEGGSAGKKKTLLDSDVTFGNKLCCFNPKKDIEYRYLNYFLSSSEYEKHFFNQMSGLIGGVSVSRLKNFPIVFPNYNEQKLIADILDVQTKKINSIIKDTEQSIEDFKKYKQSIITETVTKGLNPNVVMKDSEIEWIEKIPKQWNEIKIKYILNEKNEKSVTGEEEPLSMSQKYGIIPSKYMDRIPNPSASNVGNRIVERNDLVFNKLKAHLGVFDVSKYDGIVSPDYAVYQIKGQNNINIGYLNYLFKTPLMIAEFIRNSRGVGAGLTRLYTSEFFNIKVPIPSFNEQNQIVAHLDKEINKINNLIKDKEKMIEEIEKYKKSLIYEYLTGKKEV